MALIFTLDLTTPDSIRLHALYVFPLAAIALQCERKAWILGGVVLSVAFQLVTFLQNGLPAAALVTDLVVAAMASVLTVVLGRVARKREHALRDSQNVLHSILDSTSDGFLRLGPSGRLGEVNAAFCQMSGYTREELRGNLPTGLIAQDSELVRLLRRQRIADLGRNLFESMLTRKDGSFCPVEVSVTSGGAMRQELFVFLRDITRRRQKADRLRLAASVFDNAREGIMIADTRGTILEVNNTFTRITGYSQEEAVGQNPRILQSGRQPPEFFVRMWKSILEQGHWRGEVWNRRKNGEVYAELLNVSAVSDAAGKVQSYVAHFSDIAPVREHQEQLERVAHFDALTQLPNRLLLTDRLQQAMAQSQRRKKSLAVIYLDLDGFTAINDRHGHAAGDELLMTLAARLKAALRDGDTLARTGGDEFVAVLVGLEHAADCNPVLDRLLLAAATPVTLAGDAGDVVMQVSASLGVTLYPADSVDADLLLRHADQAMYAAKQGGKNRYHLFDVAQDAALQIQRESLEHIGAALQRKEFVLHYQPKVNMSTGKVIGAEALIRWQHPQRGLLPPAAFLSVIENHALSIDVGEWVIDTALAQHSAWHAQGLDIPISVNIGARQFQPDDFVERLGQLLAAHPDVTPHRLQLEVLETSALEDVQRVEITMKACQALGVSFALDDFGTGYSSLTYLKHLPAELLKIDQSFVRDMLEDPNDLAIVTGVIALAKAFGRQVIAEGVETAAHGALLLSIGCKLAQGYGIARPMPAAGIPDWVISWHLTAHWTA